MKILRTTDTVLRDSLGRVLKIRPDTYVEPDPNIFMVQIDVEANQTVTLPTPNMAQANVSHTIDLYDTYLGTILQSSSTTTTPSISRALAANTEYYVRLRGITSEFLYNMQVTGAGTAVPDPTTDVISITVGTPLTGLYSYYAKDTWFKFKTTTASTYVVTSPMGVGPAYNYTVDWDYIGGTIPPVSGINTYNHASATYTYQFAGTYVIAITGSMPGWSVNNTGNMRLSITNAVSWGNVGLRKIDFYGCTAMTTLPNQPSKLSGIYSFANFCNGCTSLVSIPFGTFFGNSTVRLFTNAFYNCTAMRTILSTTFRDCIDAAYFDATFAYCSALLSLPSKLFEFNYKVASFNSTFWKCTSLTAVPVDLFYRAMMDIDYSKIVPSSMTYTFFNCSSLLSIPSGFLSSPQLDNLGLNVVKATNVTGMFTACTAMTSMPEYLFHNQIYCTTASNTLCQCNSLTTIARSTFEGCSELTNAGGYSYVDSQYRYGVFGQCANLLTIDKDQFKDCVKLQDVTYMAYACPKLVSIDTGAFSNCPAIVNFGAIFQSCDKFTTLYTGIFDASPLATNFGGAFAYCALPTIDPYLFRYNTLATGFISTFQNITEITTIPEILFSTCTVGANQSFNSTFAGCTGITAIPPLLFRNNYQVVSFASVFSGCTGIVRIPVINEGGVDYGLFNFNPIVGTFFQAFYNCNLRDTVDGPGIPGITFQGNTEVTGLYSGSANIGSFYGTFQGNRMLQTIPDLLFYNCSKATDFTAVFQGCDNVALTTIPAGLFSGNSNAERFTQAFYGTSITSIPEDLFKFCVRASTFNYCFYQTKITSIPSKLLGDAINGPRGSVQDVSYMFQRSYFLTSIGADLFKYTINIQSFNYVFAECTALKTIPQDLFKLADVVPAVTSIANTMSYAFWNCTELIDVGTNLFRFNPGVLNFSYVFAGCNRLKPEISMFYEPGERATRFLNKQINFTQFLYRTAYVVMDTYMELYWVKDGALVQADDNTAGNYQPQIARGILANTDVYIKVYMKNGLDAATYDIVTTQSGGTPVTATPEAGVTVLTPGTPLLGETISGTQVKWYKYRTTTVTSYTYTTRMDLQASSFTPYKGTAPDLWNCTYTFAPTKSNAFGGAGNSANSLTNYADIVSNGWNV